MSKLKMPSENIVERDKKNYFKNKIETGNMPPYNNGLLYYMVLNCDFRLVANASLNLPGQLLHWSVCARICVYFDK